MMITMKQFKYYTEFKAYLETLTHVDVCVFDHLSELNLFSAWLEGKAIKNIVRIKRSDIYDYMTYQKQLGNQQGTQNRKLNSLRKYYDCMIDLGHIERNPASGIYIGKRKQKVVENPLSNIELNNLFQNISTYFETREKVSNYKTDVFEKINKRDTLIVSLMVFQGLNTGELDRLTVEDVNVKKGTIYIGSSGRSVSRVLRLDTSQTIPFYEYLLQLESSQSKLFSIRVRSYMFELLKIIRAIEPKVKNAEHIRQSRIIAWVSDLDIRTAQYQIGHRYVSSTEKYLIHTTDDLVDELNKIHLFKY
jgi:integrase/recombinase XerD